MLKEIKSPYEILKNNTIIIKTKTTSIYQKKKK